MARKGFSDVLDPTKKPPREEQIGRSSEKLNESDLRSLEEQIRQDESAMAQKLDLTPGADVSDLKKRIADKKMIVQHDEDLRPKTDGQSNRLQARAKEIEAILVKEMPTKREMWAKTGTIESARAVQHALKFKARENLCREWQDIQNKMNPDDPNAQSLELIRPD